MAEKKDPVEYLEEHCAAFPQFAEKLAPMASLHQRKLWHQLSTDLTTFFEDSATDAGDNKLSLFNNFISHFELFLNPLALARLGAKAACQQPDAAKSLEFLEAVLAKVTAERKDKYQDTAAQARSEAQLFVQMRMNHWNMVLEKFEDVKESLEKGKEQVESFFSDDPLVHSSFYCAAKEYYKARGPPENFYKAGLKFLAYTPVETLEASERQELAFDLSISAMIGENVFNFGEVIQTPIFQSLEGTSQEWCCEILKAYAAGDMAVFNTLMTKYASQFESNPALKANKDYVVEKARLLTLVELVFKRPSTERKITFADIATAADIPVEQVEYLLMKAMAMELVKGRIDQVLQSVLITYIKPRVLDNSQIEQLCGRLDQWSQSVDTTLRFIEDQTPELFV